MIKTTPFEMVFIIRDYMDWRFRGEDYACNLRVAGIAVRNGYLLVQREKNGSEYALPGGHVQIGEIMEDALVREYWEEIGVRILPKNLIWTEECFWEWNGIPTHTITFYYKIALCGNIEITTDSFLPHKDNPNIEYGWISIDNLENITIYPEFMKTKIHNLNQKHQHFITRA